MTTFIYTRVSTDKQTHDSQLGDLRQYCLHRKWDITEEIADTVSGSRSSREGLDRLMALVRLGKVDQVVCYKLDRLGRSLTHLAQIIGELTNNHVALVVPSQGIDTSVSNPASSLQLNILCAVAQFEREIIRERVNSGLAAAKKRGVVLGRPRELTKEFVEVGKLLEQAVSVRAIARELEIPHSTAVMLAKRYRREKILSVSTLI